MNNFIKKKILNKSFKNKHFLYFNFWEAQFKNVKFERCIIDNSIFCDARFENVLFHNCTIKNSNFSHTYFHNTKIVKSKISGSNFRDALRDKKSKLQIKISSDEPIASFDYLKKNSMEKLKLSKIETKIYYALTKGKGFYLVKNYFNKSKIKKAFKIIDNIVMKDKKIKSNLNNFVKDKKFNQKWIYNLLNKNKVFLDLIQPNPAMNVFKNILGNDFICGFFGANCLLPGARGQIPHLDYPYYRFVKPGNKIPFKAKKNFFLNCQVLIPLTKFDKTNGSTAFLKNSHKINKFPFKDEFKKKSFSQLNIDIGSFVIFNGLTWHLAQPNYSNSKKRYGILAQYLPSFLSPQLDLKTITNRKVINKDKRYLKQLLGINLQFPSIRK